MAGIAPYATPDDLALYLIDVAEPQNTAIWKILLSVASRFLDNQCGQYFYADDPSNKFFDGYGSNKIDTDTHPFWGKSGTIAACSPGATTLTYTPTTALALAPAVNDVLTLDVASSQEQVTVLTVTGTASPYTLTLTGTGTKFQHAAKTVATTLQVTLAYFENQPIAQWTGALSGDGVTPPTNYFCWPRNRPNAGSTSNPLAYRPFYGIDIARIPISATQYLPSSIPGYMTIEINANWGWPAVPDLIKDLTCKIAARLWRARESGWSEVLGATDIGVVKMFNAFDPIDQFTLFASDLVNRYL